MYVLNDIFCKYFVCRRQRTREGRKRSEVSTTNVQDLSGSSFPDLFHPAAISRQVRNGQCSESVLDSNGYQLGP